MFALIGVQTVCKGYQQMTKVAVVKIRLQQPCKNFVHMYTYEADSILL